MRLTTYTDYALRVMMYLALKHPQGDVATISEIARAYGISRAHLMKVVNHLAQKGFIETVRGRTGGARLTRDPAKISVGELVRATEPDFAVVPCHDPGAKPQCVVMPACNLRRVMSRAVAAFIESLDAVTLEETITVPKVAARLLRIDPVRAAQR